MAQLIALVAFTQNGFLTLDALKQLIEVDRLLIVVGDTDTQGLDHILFVGTTGQQDGFKGALLARQFLQVLGQFDAVHVGHVQVAQHQTDF